MNYPAQFEFNKLDDVYVMSRDVIFVIVHFYGTPRGVLSYLDSTGMCRLKTLLFDFLALKASTFFRSISPKSTFFPFDQS